MNREEYIESLREEIKALKDKVLVLEAAVEYNRASDEAEFGPGHPVFELANENDHLHREIHKLLVKLNEN